MCSFDITFWCCDSSVYSCAKIKNSVLLIFALTCSLLYLQFVSEHSNGSCALSAQEMYKLNMLCTDEKMTRIRSINWAYTAVYLPAHFSSKDTLRGKPSRQMRERSQPTIPIPTETEKGKKVCPTASQLVHNDSEK